MLDRNTELDRALDELFSGRLPATRDPELRQLVRVASRVRRNRNELSAERRAALKARVLRNLDASRRPCLRDRIAIALSLVPRPLPLVYRASVALLLVVAIVGGAGLASADSVPDDLLYGVKLTSEQVRLSLAQAPQDLVAVELTIAETRLREAMALSAQQRDAEADVAASAFGEHLAAAAANIEPTRAQDVALLAQIRQRVIGQQQQLPPISARATPNALSVLRTATREIAAASPNARSIADAAARAAESAAQLVTADANYDDDAASVAASATFAPPTLPGATRATNGAATQSASPTPTRNSRGTATPDTKVKAKRDAAIKAARQAAERARQAAERARQRHQDGEDQSSDQSSDYSKEHGGDNGDH